MTPEEFTETVVPQIVTCWERDCFCKNPAFLKLVSFKFQDYGIGPTGLIDSEVLINEIIRKRFRPISEPISSQGVITQEYTCPQCSATCTESYSEYSIAMHQASIEFGGDSKAASIALYLVGFFGFDQNDFAAIRDFRKISETADFIGQLNGG